MNRITAYRVHFENAEASDEPGTTYYLEVPEFGSAEEEPRIETVNVQLPRNVRVARSGTGAWLLYRDHFAYGMGLQEALRAGWAWLDETEASEYPPDREEQGDGGTGGDSRDRSSQRSDA